MSDAQLAQIPLGGGLDETNDDAFVPETAMRVCLNAVFPDQNTCTKRKGLQSIGSVPNAAKLIAHDSAILALDGQQAWSYVPSQSTFAAIGSLPGCIASRTLLASGNSTLPGTGSSFSNPIVPLGTQAEDATTGLRVYAWTDGIATLASVYDTVSKTFILNDVQLNATAGNNTGWEAARPRIVIIAGYAYVMYPNFLLGPNAIVYRSINLASPLSGFAAETELFFDGGVPIEAYYYDAWDACECYFNLFGVLAPAIAIGAMNAGSSAGQSVRLWIYNVTSAGVLTTTPGYVLLQNPPTGVTTFAIAATPTSLGLGSQAVTIAWGYYVTSGGTTTYTLDFAQYTPSLNAGTLAQIKAPTTVYTSTDTPANTTVNYLAARGAGAVYAPSGILLTYTTDYRMQSRQGGTGAAANDNRLLTSFRWALLNFLGVAANGGPWIGYQTQSKPFLFTINGNPEFFVLAQSQDGQRSGLGGTQTILTSGSQTLVLLQVPTGSTLTWNPPLPMGVAAPRFAGNAFAGNSDVSIASDGTGFTCIGTEQDISNATSLSALRFNFQDPSLYQSVRLGDWTWISASLPMIYDGSILTEVGFVNPPNAPTVGFGAAGSVIPAISALTYYLVYVQQDSHGNIHRSPASAPTVVNSTGYASAKLGIVPCAMTYRQTPPTVNTAGVIGPHPIRIEIYRNNSGAGLQVFQLIDSIPNDPTTDVIYYTDTTQDAAGVTTAPILYTTGGAVASDGPPSLSALSVHSTRVFGIAEDGVTAYFTTALVRGEAPRFSDSFTITWPEGPITAMWSLEQRLHAATSEDIWYIFGDGPNDSGAGSDFTLPSLWQASLGVVDARGVAVLPLGVLLNTSKGIYIEGRDGSFTWLQQCRRTLASYPVVTSMTVLDADGVVRINLQTANGAGQNGVTVHWDYRHNRFAQHTYLSSYGNGLLDSCNAGGTYYAIRNTGSAVTVLKEQATSCFDAGGGNWVMMQLVTGWANIADKQGSQRLNRVMLLAQSTTPHGMTVETARDYSANFDADIATWTDAQIATFPLEQMRHTPTQQKCMAVSVRLTDQVPTTLGAGTGAGPIMRSALLRLRAKRGEWKRTSIGQQG